MRVKFLLLCLLGVCSVQAQNFAPVGASWYYGEGSFGPFENVEDYIQFSMEKDTIVNGKACRKIVKRHQLVCNFRPEYEFITDVNDTVLFWDPDYQEFEILYVLDTSSGYQWITEFKNELGNKDSLTVHVDSVTTQLINGTVSQVLYVTYSRKISSGQITYPSRIVERIGDMQYMFNWSPWVDGVCDGNYSLGLRCYEDSVLGLFETGIADSCDHVEPWIPGIENQEISEYLTVQPNPFSNSIELIAFNHNPQLTFDIFDLAGKQLLHGSLSEERIEVNLSQLQAGIYLLVLRSEEELLGQMRMVKK